MDPLYWSFLLLGLGFALVVLEVFIPSAGLLGLMAACFMIAGIVFAFMQGYYAGSAVLLLTLLAIPVYAALMVYIWPRTPIGKLILLNDLRPDDVVPNDQHYRRMVELIGRLGVAKSEMILSGQVLIDDEKFDAISTGFPIEAGAPIKVVAVKGNHIYVEAHDGQAMGESEMTELPVRDRDVLATPIEELGIDLDEK